MMIKKYFTVFVLCVSLLGSGVFAKDFKIEKIENKKSMPALSDSVEVTFITKAPKYTYDVLCEATFLRSNKTRKKGKYRDMFISSIKKEVRKCGGQLALVSNLDNELAKVEKKNSLFRINVKAIVKTGDDIRLTAADESKLIELAKMDDAMAVAKYLGNKKVSTDVNKRAKKDSKTLNKVLAYTAHMGKDCPKNTLRFLSDKYNVKLTTLAKYASYPKGKISYCSEVVADSMDSIEDKKTLVAVVVNQAVYAYKSKDKVAEKATASLLPRVEAIINDACKKGQADICAEKKGLEDMKKHKAAIQKYGPKKTVRKETVRSSSSGPLYY